MTTLDDRDATAVAIRPGRADEAPALARLRYHMRAELARALEAEEPFVRRCAEWMAARLGVADGTWRCWVAEGRSELLGNLWLQRLEKLPNPADEPERHAYVTNVYVLPEARGAGLGGRLLRAALDWCRDSDVDAVLLWPSARSRPLYERHGFGARDDLFALRPVQRPR
jgi:GNAT superfamily N-acetyltransferase